mmetsp:Transcript_47459/g.57469  ORF Transcript_47459/g.57469 Transcript_47459/m.57469 type:complete len:187 (-) Transcript_47459:95-655(-)
MTNILATSAPPTTRDSLGSFYGPTLGDDVPNTHTVGDALKAYGSPTTSDQVKNKPYYDTPPNIASPAAHDIVSSNHILVMSDVHPDSLTDGNIHITVAAINILATSALPTALNSLGCSHNPTLGDKVPNIHTAGDSQKAPGSPTTSDHIKRNPCYGTSPNIASPAGHNIVSSNHISVISNGQRSPT